MHKRTASSSSLAAGAAADGAAGGAAGGGLFHRVSSIKNLLTGQVGK